MISSAYNYYLSNYIGREVSRYDTHKKSELRDVYNRMVKVNKASSLYKIAEGDDVKKYAIDLKEAARAITNITSELSDGDDINAGFLKKKAASTNESVVEAKYIGEGQEEVGDIRLKVESLASPQVNTGKFLPQNERGLNEGTYSFDFSIGEYTYEFQFNVKNGEDNRDVQDKLARLINRSNLGVKASVMEKDSSSALTIESDATGVLNYNGTIFRINPNSGNLGTNPVAYFGLDNISKNPENARFTINGLEKTSSSNTFTIAKQFLVNLNSVSLGDEETVIRLKPDFDSVLDNIHELIDKYNSMVDLAKDKSNGTYESEKLYRDVKNISSYYKNILEPEGFKIEDDGKIKVQESLIIQSANEGTLKDSLDKLGSFKKAITNKANSIALNPMAYVDKKLIAYKNPIRNLNSPYVTSTYSGMMFNGYV